MNFYNKFGSKRNITEKLFIFNKEIKKSLRNIVKDFMKSSNKTRRGTRAARSKNSVYFSSSNFNVNKIHTNNLHRKASILNFNENIESEIPNNKYNFSLPLESQNEQMVKPLQFDIIEKNLKEFANKNNNEDNNNNNNYNLNNNNSEEFNNEIGISSDNNDNKKKKFIIDSKNDNNNNNNNDSFNYEIDKKDILYYNYNKNEYNIYFISYIFGKIFQKLNCCKSKISKSYELHESTCSFYDYYMDINTYLKMMIEFDIVKGIVLGKKKNSLLKKFRPIITRKYKIIYNEKLEDFYTEKFSNNEINKIKRGMEVFGNERNTGAISSFAKYI